MTVTKHMYHAPSPRNSLELMPLFYERYRKALLQIVKGGECMCGGQGRDEGHMLYIEGEPLTGYGHHDGCPPIVAAKALGLKITRG